MAARQSETPIASMSRCGTTDPGTAASASSSTNAVRIEVSCRHAQRASSTGVSAGGAEGGVGLSGAPPAPVAGCCAFVVWVRAGYTTTWKPPTQPRSSPTHWSHRPVTSSSPTATSMTPPARVTHSWCRRTHPTAPSTRR